MSNPNLLFYFDMPAAILSAILFAALTIYYKHKTKPYYVIMVMSLLISCYSLIKTAGTVLRNEPMEHDFNFVSITNLTAHLLHVIIAFELFYMFLTLKNDGQKYSLWQQLLFVAPALVVLTFLLLPELRPMLYVIKPTGEYVHGPLHILFNIELETYVVMAIAVILRHKKLLGREFKIALWSTVAYGLTYLVDNLLQIRISNFVMVVGLSNLTIVLTQDEKELWRKNSLRDQLTGLKNRFALQEDINSYLNHQTCVALLDVDDFKHVNDTFGHACGDEAIHRCGQLISLYFPNQGYRYGGDEFLIISRLPEPDFRKALISLQTEIMSQKFAGVAGRVTVTVGFCSGKPLTDLDLTDMFKKADRMMYSGKRSHRYDTTDNGQDGTLSGIEAKQHNQ